MQGVGVGAWEMGNHLCVLKGEPLDLTVTKFLRERERGLLMVVEGSRPIWRNQSRLGQVASFLSTMEGDCRLSEQHCNQQGLASNQAQLQGAPRWKEERVYPWGRGRLAARGP